MKVSHEEKFLKSTKREQPFYSRWFTYWKEATSAFKKHQNSDCHQEANEAIILLPNAVLGDIGNVLCKKHKEEKAVN